MNKIIGWILLLIGLAIIFLSIYYSYNIFTAKTQAPEIIPLEIVLDSQKENISNPSQILEDETNLLIKERLEEVVPSNSFPVLFNLIAWSIFVGILIFAGGQIAGVGVKLIKK